MRVLGVDPGLTRCGIGVVDGDSTRRVTLVDMGVLRSETTLPIEQRLQVIHAGIVTYIESHGPDQLAVERVFAQQNVRTAIGTAQASAVIMLAAVDAGIPVAMHTPSEVKAAVTGNGRADKKQVGAMVKRLLRLEAEPKPADTADALALAICHVWRAPLTGRMFAAAQGRPE